jgi:chromosome segregation ATPase
LCLQVDLEKAKQEIRSLDEARIDAYSHSLDLEKENKDLKVKVTGSQELVYNLQHEKEDVEATCKKNSDKLSKALQKIAALKASSDMDKQSLGRGLEAARAEIGSLQENIKSGLQKMEALEALSNFEKQMLGKELEAALGEIDSLKENFKSASSETQILREEYSQVQKSLTVTEQSLSELKSSNEMLQMLNAELQQVKTTLETSIVNLDNTAASERLELMKCKEELVEARKALDKDMASSVDKEKTLSEIIAQVDSIKDKLNAPAVKKSLLSRDLLLAGAVAVVAAFTAGLSAHSSCSGKF